MKFTCLLVLLVCIQSCCAQRQVIDCSITFLDMKGLMMGYELQYVVTQKRQLDESQKEILFMETRKIAMAYGREIEFVDFVNERDSIEEAFASDVIEQMRSKRIAIEELNIINLMVSKHIVDAIAQKAKLMNEQPPERIKILGR